MKKIKLSKGYEVIIDDEDFERVNQYKWSAKICDSGKIYAQRGIKINNKKSTMKLSRFIMNNPKGMDIDHISGNTLDDRKKNLRICTHSQNQRNKKIYKNNTSGYKGVTFDKNTKKWVAQIGLNGKIIRIGYFLNKIIAAKAYNNSARKHYGDFARLNNFSSLK